MPSDRKMILTISGYSDWAFTPEDALAFIALCDKAINVKQRSYTKHWDVVDAGETEREIVSSCVMGTVHLPEPVPEEAPKPPRPVLQIGHTPKLTPPEDDVPF